MAEPERDTEAALRVGQLVAGLTQLMADQKVGDVQVAIANFVCRMAAGTNPADPDKVLIEMHAVLLEVWDSYRLHLKRGTKPPDAIVN